MTATLIHIDGADLLAELDEHGWTQGAWTAHLASPYTLAQRDLLLRDWTQVFGPLESAQS